MRMTAPVVPFHPEGFGIVGFAEMSRSEKTLMTYQVSGSISYWDLATGQQTLDLPAVAYLSRIRISSDRRFIFGSTGREIVLVDAVTGAAKARAKVPAVASLDISAAGDEVSAIGADGRIMRWSIAGDTLTPRPADPRSPPPSLVLCYGTGALYAAEKREGLRQSGLPTAPFISVTISLAAVSGLDAAHGLVALGRRAGSGHSRPTSDGATAPSFLHTVLAANPFSSRISLLFLPMDRLLAWRTDTAAPGLAVMDVSRIDDEALPALAGQPADGVSCPVERTACCR